MEYSLGAMRLLFLADGRSPTALNWIEYFIYQGHEVHLVSTHPCEPGPGLASFWLAPVAFSEVAGAKPAGWGWKALIPVGLRTALRQRVGPATLLRSARRFREILERVQPDLVHAMRIPYEGILAALAQPACPLLVSVWGNDFTLHASSTKKMAQLTQLCLQRASALHTDCQRDARLARIWGFSPEKPEIVLPGGGGVQPDIFYPPDGGLQAASLSEGFSAGRSGPIVTNPRGLRAYVRNDVFFKAIPLILENASQVQFICPAMQGETQPERWVSELGIAEHVSLLPKLARPKMADLFRCAQVTVSPSTHDGTPNTLLEAMACGSFPVVGDLESLREWIVPGVNGLLADPNDPHSLAEAILLALQREELRSEAAAYNHTLITRRAIYSDVMAQAEEFYENLSTGKGIAGSS